MRTLSSTMTTQKTSGLWGLSNSHSRVSRLPQVEFRSFLGIARDPSYLRIARFSWTIDLSESTAGSEWLSAYILTVSVGNQCWTYFRADLTSWTLPDLHVSCKISTTTYCDLPVVTACQHNLPGRSAVISRKKLTSKKRVHDKPGRKHWGLNNCDGLYP